MGTAARNRGKDEPPRQSFGVEGDGDTCEDATRRVREQLESGWLACSWRVVHPDAPSPTS